MGVKIRDSNIDRGRLPNDLRGEGKREPIGEGEIFAQRRDVGKAGFTRRAEKGEAEEGRGRFDGTTELGGGLVSRGGLKRAEKGRQGKV